MQLTNDMIGLLGWFADSDEELVPVSAPFQVSLVGVKVEAEVVDFIAEVKLTQCYLNTHDKPIEATYNFPVEEGGAVCGFQAKYEDGTIVKGVVKEKNEARREYTEAVRRGKQANLLESVRRDIFTLNVGNIPPKEFVQITITYITSLKAREDAAAFILPTYIAPRYTPPGERNMTDLEAQALAPPTAGVKFFGMDIKINFACRSNIKEITSPTHTSEPGISCEVQGKKGFFGLEDVPMDRDIVVLVTEEECHQPRVCFEILEDGTSKAGFVTLFPKLEFQDLPREFVFVVDRSGSMHGNKIEQARDALLLFLRALPATCTFNIVGFGSRFEPLFDSPVKYTNESLELASRYAMNMQADLGGTEIVSPLNFVLGQEPPAGGIERAVFVLTDGQVSNDKQVFDAIRPHCSPKSKNKCRLFSVGIGAGVSRHLVEGMARAGRGTSRFVEEGSEDLLRVKVLGQLKQALQPSLDNVSIKWNFPVREVKVPSSPEKNTVPVKSLLGYRSPLIDETPANPSPKMYPSITPPIFNQERFLSFALFSHDDGMPESVSVMCETSDGPLEVTLPISEDEIFHGSIAHKMAARTAIVEHEDHQKGRNYIMGSVAPLGVITHTEAVQLAIANNLASENTSFIAVKENQSGQERPDTKSKKDVIPQHMGSPKLSSHHDSLACSFSSYAPGSMPLSAGSSPWGSDSSSRSYRVSSGRIPLSYDHVPVACSFMSVGDPSPQTTHSSRLNQRLRDSRGGVSLCAGEQNRVRSSYVSRNHAAPRYSAAPNPFPGYGAASSAASCATFAPAFSPVPCAAPSPVPCAAPFPVPEIYRTQELAAEEQAVIEPVMGCVKLEELSRQSEKFYKSAKKSTAFSFVPGMTFGLKEKLKNWTNPRATAASLAKTTDVSDAKKQMWALQGEEEYAKSTGSVPGKATLVQDAVNKQVCGMQTSQQNETFESQDNNDEVLQLCLLQNADGSFNLDEKLTQAMGISKDMMDSIFSSQTNRIPLLTPGVFATMLAVASMRSRFASYKNIWELQEDKALKFLVSHGLDRSDLDAVLGEIEVLLVG